MRSSVASGLRRLVAAGWEDVARDRGLLAAIRAELTLEPGERVLSAGGDPDGECVLVATDQALYHRRSPGRAGLPAAGAQAGGWARLGWEQVAQVGWDAVAGQLIVIGIPSPAGTARDAATGGGFGAAAPRVVVPLRRRGGVPELALERITHTRLGQWQLRVDGRRRAVIEARRRPGSGELLWSVTCDGGEKDAGPGGGNGHGPGDQDLRARVERAIARLSAEFGAPPEP